jgi:hypothetical protein
MIITIGVWVIPVVVNVVWILLMVRSVMECSSGWFTGLAEMIFGTIGTLIIWLVFFAVMYFCK